MQDLGLSGKSKQKVASLSGGEKQRVAIARMILQDPNIMLADEPVASLDPTLSDDILNGLIGAAKDKTLLVSLHQKDYALKYFDRIIGLKNGAVFFDLKTEKVTEEFLNALYERY